VNFLKLKEEIMQTKDLQTIIGKSDFAGLLQSHGFQEIYKWHEKNDGYHDRYLIGFQSKLCRIAFYYEPGTGFSVLVGTLSDDFNDSKTADWVGLDYLISYILKQPIRWGNQVSKSAAYTEELIKGLNILATRFEPLSKQIISMFLDKKTVTQWKPELKQYINDETRRHYQISS